MRNGKNLTVSQQRVGEKLLETQKASRGEFFVQFIYATAAAVGFAYVSVLIFALATGNLQPLTEHPGLTALLCLLSGISLANLCRHQSSRFWKVADLVWIVAFVPSLAMTLLQHQQEQAQQKFNILIEATVEAHTASVKNWEVFRIQNCNKQNPISTEACLILDRFGDWINTYGSTEESYYFLVTGRGTANQILLDDRESAIYEKFVDLDGHIFQFESVAISTLATLNKVQRQLGLPDLMLPSGVEDFGTSLIPITDISSLHSVYGKIPVGITFSAAEKEQFNQVRQVYSLLADIWTAKLRLEYLIGFYDAKIAVIIPNLGFLPLIIACFVFPFRVGKSIFEIAAKKESKNAPVSS